MRGECWRRYREIERRRGASAFRNGDQALARRAISYGRLPVIGGSNHHCAITYRRRAYRREDAVTERHQDHEDAQQDLPVPGTEKPWSAT
jgi:hypothetical protein